MVCIGCDYANKLREREQRQVHKCPFCRHPLAGTKADDDKNIMKRIEANDPVAIGRKGWKHYQEGDYSGAFEYLTKAAKLGDIEAHVELSILYMKGEGVEKDEKKTIVPFGRGCNWWASTG